MKRKSILSVFFVAVLLLSSVLPVFAERPIKVMVGGEILTTDVAPEIVDGRILLPLRAVFEAIGAEISWDGETKTVTAERNGDKVSFTIGEKVMKINGTDKETDVPATIKNGRTLVPLRACAEAFDLDVSWDSKKRMARVKIPVMAISEERSEYSDNVTKYTYNDDGDVATKESYGRITYYSYSEDGLLLNTITKDENGNILFNDKYTYNEYGDLLELASESGNGYIYEYDANGNNTYKASKSTDFWERKTYDENNKITYEENNKGEWEKTTYYENGLVATTSSYGLSRYTDNTTLSVRTDVQRTYNSSGQLLTYMSQKQVRTLYGASLSNIPDTNVERYYTYDDKGNLTGTYGSEGTTVYKYDENNLKVYEKTYQGWEIYYTYDEEGRVIVRETIKQNEIIDVCYDYDEYGNVITYAHIVYSTKNDPENPTVQKESYTDYEYEYDKNGNVLIKRVLGDNKPSEYVYEYDEEGNLIYEKDADGVWKRYIRIVK